MWLELNMNEYKNQLINFISCEFNQIEMKFDSDYQMKTKWSRIKDNQIEFYIIRVHHIKNKKQTNNWNEMRYEMNQITWRRRFRRPEDSWTANRPFGPRECLVMAGQRWIGVSELTKKFEREEKKRRREWMDELIDFLVWCWYNYVVDELDSNSF